MKNSFVVSYLAVLAAVFAVCPTQTAAAPPGSSEEVNRDSNARLYASPTPAAGIRTRSVVTTQNGETVTTLRSLSDSAIIIVGGHPTRVQTLRDAVRKETLATLGPPKTTTRSGFFSTGIAGVVAGAKYDQTASLNDSRASVLAGSRSGSDTLAAKVSRRPDPNYCKTNPPYISDVKGRVTPNGYVVIDGGCFGESGTVRLNGRFAQGALSLTPQHWSDESITVAIPDVSGVLDQVVTLQISRGNMVSDGKSLRFIAARERLPLPAHFITAATCDQKAAAAQCLDGTGFRMELHRSLFTGADIAGVDTWEAKAPAGWTLESMDFRTGVGSAEYVGGFEKGSDDFARWGMAWKADVARTMTTTKLLLGFAVSSDTQYFYGSTYAMTVYAVGPKGTMPS